MENKTYVICHDNIVETYDYSQHTEFVERLRELQEEFDNKGRILMCPHRKLLPQHDHLKRKMDELLEDSQFRQLR